MGVNETDAEEDWRTLEKRSVQLSAKRPSVFQPTDWTLLQRFPHIPVNQWESIEALKLSPPLFEKGHVIQVLSTSRTPPNPVTLLSVSCCSGNKWPWPWDASLCLSCCDFWQQGGAGAARQADWVNVSAAIHSKSRRQNLSTLKPHRASSCWLT